MIIMRKKKGSIRNFIYQKKISTEDFQLMPITILTYI